MASRMMLAISGSDLSASCWSSCRACSPVWPSTDKSKLQNDPRLIWIFNPTAPATSVEAVVTFCTGFSGAFTGLDAGTSGTVCAASLACFSATSRLASSSCSFSRASACAVSLFIWAPRLLVRSLLSSAQGSLPGSPCRSCTGRHRHRARCSLPSMCRYYRQAGW